MIMPSISFIFIFFFIAKDAYSLSELSGFIPSRSNRSKDRGKRVRCPLPLLELHTTQQATRLSSVSNPPSSSDFM